MTSTKRTRTRKSAEVITGEGTIARQDDGSFIVKVKGATHLASMAEVACENPDAAEGDRIYTRVFHKKPIYLPHEYDRAYNEVLRGNDVVVLGMNGYSALSDAKCREYGVRPGAYEAACAGILDRVINDLEQSYPGIKVRIAHGASTMGVDRVQIEVATQRNLNQLGHSCPKFMFYVPDDDVPVYVAASQVEYSNAFVDSLQILIAANGREQAFRHDIDAVFTKLRHLIPINVLRAISTNGGPPAINADGKIEDAVAAFEQRMHLAAHLTVSSGDLFADAVAHATKQTRAIARNLLSPQRAFRSMQLRDMN